MKPLTSLDRSEFWDGLTDRMLHSIFFLLGFGWFVLIIQLAGNASAYFLP